MENKIILTDEQRKKLIDETNQMIDNNNMLALDIASISDRVARIGLFHMITAKKEDRELFKAAKEHFNNMYTTYLTNMHKIDVNKKILGIKPKKISLIKTRH